MRENTNTENKMIITVGSSLNADGFDIVVVDKDLKKLFKNSYHYGYNASWKQSWANNDKPYVTDIIKDLCDRYDVPKENIEVTTGKNVFTGSDVNDKAVNRFIKNYIGESLRRCYRNKLMEKSNFDTVDKAIKYYYPKWYYGDMSVNDIFDRLEKLGHSQDFIYAVIHGISDKYENEEDYELDDYDECLTTEDLCLENKYGTLADYLERHLDSWYGRLNEIGEDIEELGLDVDEINDEYIVVHAAEPDGEDAYCKIRLGGTERTISLEKFEMLESVRRSKKSISESYYSYDNLRISEILDKIEQTNDQRKIDKAYDFINHACDNIDDCMETGFYDLSDASWGYGADYIIDELTDILNESIKQQKRKVRIHEAKKPRYWNSRFAAEVIDAYESGKLTLTNISDWETDYNNGVKPNPSLGTKEILRYYISTGNDPRKKN